MGHGGFPVAQHFYIGFQRCFISAIFSFLLDEEAETLMSPENKLKEHHNRKAVFLLLLNKTKKQQQQNLSPNKEAK